MFGSFMPGIVNNAYLKKISARVVNENQLPELFIPRTPTAFLNLAGVLAHRLDFYEGTFKRMKVPFYGPYAVSLTVIAKFRPTFAEHIDQRKQDLANMAELSHQYMQLRAAYKKGLHAETHELQREIQQLSRDLGEISCNISAIGIGRFIDYRLGQLREKRRKVNALLKQKRVIGKKLRKLRKAKTRLAKNIFAEYNAKIRMLASDLVLHDTETLRLDINELVADFEVLDITTQSGLLFNMLTSKDGTLGKNMRKYLQLPDNFLCGDYHEVKTYMLTMLAGRVALGPNPPREDVLETFLRIHLQDLKDEHPDFTKQFLQNLPAPGVLGKAEQLYPDVSGQRGDWLDK